MAGEHSSAQIDIEKPVFERIGRIGLPKSRGIAVDRSLSRCAPATGGPDAAGDLAPFLGRMGEEMGVADSVYLLAVFGQVQRALRVHSDQALWDGPGPPGLRVVETQYFSRAGSDQECERGCQGEYEAHLLVHQ